MILVDEPRWPAHGTHFAHLVSDSSYDELLAFARAAGLHPRAFDHDHYDIPLARHDELVALGAVPVASTELVRRLRASGLRVASTDRTPKRRSVMPRLRAAWDALWPGNPAGHQDAVRDDLLARWSAPGRHYHDVRHLAQTLDALDLLHAGRPERLAAWFHDAVYDGVPGTDEDRSAALASDLLDGHVPPAERDEVARLVRVTASHDPQPDDLPGRRLVDADLSILGQSRGRYLVYVRDVRLDYAHIADPDFVTGRRAVLAGLLAQASLFSTPQGQTLWGRCAEVNLEWEGKALATGVNVFPLASEVSS